jgi:hypothetical protein
MTQPGSPESRQGSKAMHTQYPDQTLPSMTPPQAEPAENRSGNLLYQVATIVAILLFLVSFWSC